MISPRVVTKIVQPSRSRLLVHRSRLVDFLHQHVALKLIILSASAGYGKTTLLTDFAHETTLPVCWYQLDNSDRDPQVFLEYLTATIHRRFPNVGERAQVVLGSGTGLCDCDAVIGALVTEIQEKVPDHFIVILDDYHMVAESEATNHIMDTLLLLLPEKAHLILSSRTLPTGLELTRLAVRREVVALGANELQFTGEEIRSLFYHSYQTTLSPEQAAQIAEHSEGWIAGILLTTPMLRAGLLQRLGPRAHENVYHFLANETFLQLAPEVQRFLLDSSILDRLDVETCDSVLERHDSGELLHAIEDRNLFLVRLEDANRLSYRYHNLFQEFLRQRLIETDASRWQALNRNAGEFCGRHRPCQAITHYLAAGMYYEAAGLIESIAQSILDAGRWTTLADWIDALPITVIEARPGLLVMRGIVHAELGQYDQAEAAYTQALHLYEQSGDQLAGAKTVVWRAMLWRLKGRYREAIAACQQALERLHQNGARPEEARAWRIIGSAHVLLGEFPLCVGELEESLRLYEALGDPLRVAWLHHDIGTCLRLRGDPSADQHYHQALDYWRQTENSMGMAMTLNSIGVGLHQDGDYPQAIQVLEEARTLAHRMGNRRSEAFALASLGDVYRDQGDYPRALELYQQAVDIGHHFDGFILTYTLIALGETYRLSENREKASKCLHQALGVAQKHQSNYEIGMAETALGIWEGAQGHAEGVTRRLTHAVKLLETTPRDDARARLHLAATFLAEQKYEKAKQQLKAIADRDPPLKVIAIPFLMADRGQLLPVLRFAVQKKLGNGYFRLALEQVSAATHAASSPAESAGAKIQLRALGTVQITVGERVPSRRDWGTYRVKELFFLTLHHPEGLRKEEIVECLWGHKPAAQAIMSFHNAAYRLRHVIPQCLVYEDGLYHLARGLEIDYDVAQFTRWIRRAKETENEMERMEEYQAAVALYLGDFFPECYSDWCLEIREGLRRDYLDALRALAQAWEPRDHDQAIRYYRILIEKDPDREDSYRALMRLQYRIGDRTSAVKTFQQCAHVLREELDIPSPSRETLALYELIVNER